MCVTIEQEKNCSLKISGFIDSSNSYASIQNGSLAQRGTPRLALALADFWHTVLKATLNDEFISTEVIASYKNTRLAP